MSEYWKSTPKYWCKHCKAFVRDTKLEKQNHDATPKHQGNLKRFLRDLHRGNERDEREKHRAKDEVARLNGVQLPSREVTAGKNNFPASRRAAIPPTPTSSLPQATPAERKQHMARLAELGVSIPEEYRREMAMAGDWQVTSQRLIYDDTIKKEEDDQDSKGRVLNVGIHKRKFEGQDEEGDVGEASIKRVWGSKIRIYPGAEDDDDDLDELLRSTSALHKDRRKKANGQTLGEQSSLANEGPETLESSVPVTPPIKKDTSAESGIDALPTAQGAVELSLKDEEQSAGQEIVFKRRRRKLTGQS